MNSKGFHQVPERRTILEKWSFYSGRYGTVHTLASLLGRRSTQLWGWIGPRITTRYKKAWLSNAGPHIVNLGGGGNLRDDWITADVDPRSDIYVDLRDRLPFKDSTIDGIVLEEVLEHLPLKTAAALIVECQRILKSQGTLRMSTPDLAWLTASRNDKSAFLLDNFLVEAGAKRASKEMPWTLRSLAAYNSTFYDHGHCFIYDREGIRELMSHCGFTQIKESCYQDTNSVLGYLDSHADRFGHRPELSQYVEGQKP